MNIHLTIFTGIYYHTIALISDARKVILKILQARLSQYMNCELPDVQAGFRKGRGEIKLPIPTGSAGRRTKEPLMKVKKKSENVGLKLNVQKTKIMASSPITSWQIHEIMETERLYFFNFFSNFNADGDCSQEIKTLAPWKKSYDKPRYILKSRDISLPTKVHLVKAMIFPVVKYGSEIWTIKKTEH